jgi:prepilin-type N-terminal cleavage/methylation domain-containing protein
MNNTKGFTLIEILAAVAISLIMLFAIGAAIESALKSSGGMERKVIAQQDVRGALEIMAMEIRMASYNPIMTANNSLWVNPANCVGLSGNPSWKGIQVATANSITVEMDIAGDPTGDGNGTIGEPNEIISYNYVRVDPERYITRDTNCGNPLNPPAFLGDLSTSGRPRTVRVVNVDTNPQTPIFRYFDGQGSQIPFDAAGNISDPTQIPNIRMVEITLVVDTDEINPDTHQRRRMIYSTREILRNH